jgi:hypothetical protein
MILSETLETAGAAVSYPQRRTRRAATREWDGKEKKQERSTNAGIRGGVLRLMESSLPFVAGCEPAPFTAVRPMATVAPEP